MALVAFVAVSGCGAPNTCEDFAFFLDEGLDQALLVRPPPGWSSHRAQPEDRADSEKEPLVIAERGDWRVLAKEDGRVWFIHTGADSVPNATLLRERDIMYAAMERDAPEVRMYGHQCP